MDETTRWRDMFDRGRPRPAERSDSPANQIEAAARLLAGLDNGSQPQTEKTPVTPTESAAGLPPSPQPPNEIFEEDALALAQDTSEYRPWVLQRGTRPVMMLHLRRHDPKSGLWMGWEVSYPHLIACEYTGDRLLSLDFGARQFMLEGAGLDELAGHLQNGNVLMVQEYDPSIWPAQPGTARVSAIRRLAAS